MDINVARHALVLHQPGGESVRPLLSPINDLIALRPETTYDLYLYDQYWTFWPADWFEQLDGDVNVEKLVNHISDQAARWRRRRYHKLFLAAAQDATERKLSASLAPHLEKIRWLPGNQDDNVPDGDLPALAVYTLIRALELRPLDLVECPRCRIPWLTTTDADRNPFCLRPSLGQLTTCRQLHKEEQFRTRHGDWRREYKRLHERLRRGSLSETELMAWRAENTLESWQPFELWQTQTSSPTGARPRTAQKVAPDSGAVTAQKGATATRAGQSQKTSRSKRQSTSDSKESAK